MFWHFLRFYFKVDSFRHACYTSFRQLCYDCCWRRRLIRDCCKVWRQEQRKTYSFQITRATVHSIFIVKKVRKSMNENNNKNERHIIFLITNPRRQKSGRHPKSLTYIAISYFCRENSYKVKGKLWKPKRDSPLPVKKIYLLRKLKSRRVNYCTTSSPANLYIRTDCAKSRIRVYFYFF